MCGAVGGGLEVFDFDAPGVFDAWRQIVEEAGVDLSRFSIVQTPKGYGRHLYVRCATASGSEKLARSDEVETLIEIKGEGGYVLAPGCPVECHPLRKPYVHISGPPLVTVATSPVIPDEEYQILVSGAKSLNRHAAKIVCDPQLARRETWMGPRPGDDFNARASWDEILPPHGWKRFRDSQVRIAWQRPGKSSPGLSATTGFCRNETSGDLLFVFSTNAVPFEAETAYSKFAAHALLNHGGNFGTAARDLAEKGFGASKEERANHAKTFIEGRLEEAVANKVKPVFEPDSLLAADTLRDLSPGDFAELRNKLKSIKVPIGEWDKALKRQVQERARGSKGTVTDDLPTIQKNDVQLPKKVRQAWQAIEKRNRPDPRLFLKGSSVVRIGRSGKLAQIQAISETGMFGEIARAANWIVMTKGGPIETSPDKDVSRDMLAFPDKGLPPLETIINCPHFAPSGDLIQKTGYHKKHAMYFDPKNALIVDVPDRPSSQHIAEAKELLLDQLLDDFPFVSDTDRAHAVAALILPFARRMIRGGTPLHAVDAPTPGTGKTLLGNVISIVAIGEGIKAQTIPRDDDEFRKRITAFLEKSPEIVLLDNAKRPVDSAALSSVLTSDAWTDRRLGHTEMITAKNRAVWIITGNNLQLSTEIRRRSIRIRLDAECAEPWKRSGFRHPDLATWTRKNRASLVQAILTLIRNWISRGCPGHPNKLGSFERWSDVIGGILDCAGIPGFLSVELEDSDRASWGVFAEAWYSRSRSEPRRVSEILDLAAELLPDVVGDESDRSKETRLGHALLRRCGCLLGEYRLELASDDGHKGKRYRVTPVAGWQEPVGGPPGNHRGTSTDQGSPTEATSEQPVTTNRGTSGTFSQTGLTCENENKSSDPEPSSSPPSLSERTPTGQEVPLRPTTNLSKYSYNGEPPRDKVPQRFPEGSPSDQDVRRESESHQVTLFDPEEVAPLNESEADRPGGLV